MVRDGSVGIPNLSGEVKHDDRHEGVVTLLGLLDADHFYTA